jgi:hypothetical protein
LSRIPPPTAILASRDTAGGYFAPAVQSELRSAMMAVGGFATDTCGAGRHSPLTSFRPRRLAAACGLRSFLCDDHRSKWLALYAYNDYQCQAVKYFLPTSDAADAHHRFK